MAASAAASASSHCHVHKVHPFFLFVTRLSPMTCFFSFLVVRYSCGRLRIPVEKGRLKCEGWEPAFIPAQTRARRAGRTQQSRAAKAKLSVRLVSQGSARGTFTTISFHTRAMLHWFTIIPRFTAHRDSEATRTFAATKNYCRVC